MSEMFDGFDHTQYREEVQERWGKQAYERSASWWDGKSSDDKKQFTRQVADLNADWRSAFAAGEDPAGELAQQLAARHVDWLTGIPGTPAHGGDSDAIAAYVSVLGEMYVADPRFAANYGGQDGAAFVRDALAHYIAAR